MKKKVKRKYTKKDNIKIIRGTDIVMDLNESKKSYLIKTNSIGDLNCEDDKQIGKGIVFEIDSKRKYKLKEIYKLIGCDIVQIISGLGRNGNKILLIDENSKLKLSEGNYIATALCIKNNLLFYDDYVAGNCVYLNGNQID